MCQTRTGWLQTVGVFLTFLVVGCTGTEGNEPSGGGTGGSATGGSSAGVGDVISDAPLRQSPISVSAGGVSGSNTPDPPPPDVSRILQEADVVHLVGDRLYALSSAGTLTVLDTGEASGLSVLGNVRLPGTPFELYVQGDVVFVLLNWSPGSSDRGALARVVAIDMSHPAAPSVVGTNDLAGVLTDSRIVGSVLYLVAHDTAASAQSRIVSLNVADPAHVVEVERLEFADVSDAWGTDPQSILVTGKRIYVAKRDASSNGGHTTVQVVDISDPGGLLVAGRSFAVEGQISARWQMDETGGTFRVVSQTPAWDVAQPPVVQTFRVEGASAVTPLGRAALALPTTDPLTSVRFDAASAYVITGNATGTLVTVDVSDPAAPRQTGAVETHGTVSYLEPHGERLVGLGYDSNSGDGMMAVSLFDVSSLAAPRLLDQVTFGGPGATSPEDRDRTQKAFQVLDDAGLILAPFSMAPGTCAAVMSGVALIDWNDDHLALRTVLPSQHRLRRAVLLATDLLTVADDRVERFDIADRVSPVSKASVGLSQNVNASAVSADRLVRLSNESDWAPSTVAVDVTSLAASTEPAARTTSLSLSVASCVTPYVRGLLADSSHAYVLTETFADVGATQSVVVLRADATETPRKVGELQLPTAAEVTPGEFIPSGSDFVLAGSSLVRRHVDSTIAQVWVDVPNGRPQEQRFSQRRQVNFIGLDVVDVSNPEHPQQTTLELQGSEVTGLHVDGNRVLVGRFVPLPEDADHGRYFIDAVDVSNAAAPHVDWTTQVAGSLLAWDAGTARAITVRYARTAVHGVTVDACAASAADAPTRFVADYDDRTAAGTCLSVVYSLDQVAIHDGVAVPEGTYAVAPDLFPEFATSTDGTAIVGLTRSRQPLDSTPADTAPVVVFSDLGSGSVTTASVAVKRALTPYRVTPRLAASGARALLVDEAGRNGVLLDTTDGQPHVVDKLTFDDSVQDIDMTGSVVVLSLGAKGTTLIDLAQ